MTPWSVSPRAGWPISAARAAIASILQAPSSSEYSLWAWRWTAGALLTGSADHVNQLRWSEPILDVFRAPSACISALTADPGAGTGVGPDFRGDLVLFSLGGVLGRALSAVQLPGRGEDLVGTAGAAGGVERAVVAARLAHHDVGGDREGTA